MIQLPTNYEFTPKDLQGVSLEWKRVRTQSQGIQDDFSLLQESDFGRVPDDRVWLITQASMQATPGGGQGILWGFLTENAKLETGGAPVGLVIHFKPWYGGTVDYIDGDTQQLSYAIQPGNHIRAFAHFTVGIGNSNLVIFDVAGWVIPRANIQLSGSK